MQRKPVKAIPKPTQKVAKPTQQRPKSSITKPGQIPKKTVPEVKKEPPNALTKDWALLEKNVMICSGSYSLSHKRFKARNEQSAAVCIVACVMTALRHMNTWTKPLLDQILDIGTNLHLKTRQMSDNKCMLHIEPPQVNRYFFLDDVKVSTKIGFDVLSERVPRSSTILQQLENFLTKFFARNSSGIFCCLQSHFAIWTFDKYYFVFDPFEHTAQGGKWNGFPGLGFCYVIRCTSVKGLADVILKNITLRQVNKFTIYPCVLEKAVKVNTAPPESIDEKPVPQQLKTMKTVNKASLLPSRTLAVPLATSTLVNPEATLPQFFEETPGSRSSQASAPPEGDLQPKPSVSLSMIPPERPRLQSVTKFVELAAGRLGILRASTHQCDPKFTRYLGAQSLSNAVAALTMLRRHKAKTWIRTVLDEVLKLGEVIHHDSKKLPPGQFVHKVTLKDKDYSPKIDLYSVIGRLQSDVDKILDLHQALSNFFLENDCCILIGPIGLAIWKEGDKYYMFDPNERDATGKRVRPNQPGVACVTWFKNLKDLVDLYIENVPMTERKDRFALSRVTIKDFEPVAQDWYNFKALTLDKWILRGHFSQQDRRFSPESRNSQCTANATMALAYKELVPEKDWNSDTVDECLMNGDEFYRGSVDYLRENNRLKHRYLMVDELKRNFDLKDKRITFEIDDCLVNGIINARSDTGIPNLKKGFEEFFTHSDAGIVTANLQSMAVWRKDEVYYYYDSHSRNEKGIVCGAGTACVLRMVTIDDLTKAMTTNLGSDRQNLYNISRIAVTMLDLTEEGDVKPPLNNYETISEIISILRSNFNETHSRFDLNAGKQTIPNCLAALAMNALIPSNTWNKEDVDQVLVIGDKLYTASMEANYVEDLPEEFNVDEISTNNVKRSFKIGTNAFGIEFDLLAEGNIEDNLTETIDNLYQFSQHEGLETFQAIIESPYITASMWRDENLVYFFDPKARDEKGQIYGKDDWSAKVNFADDVSETESGTLPMMEHGEEEDLELDEMGGGDNFGPVRPEELNEEQEEVVKTEFNFEPVAFTPAPQEPLMTGEEAVAEAEAAEVPPPVEKKGSAYWRALEENGKACVLRFSRVDDLIQHILENSPPNRRQEIQFSFKSVKIDNNPVLHTILQEDEEKQDPLEGDWNAFQEVDYGKWILRSSRNYNDALFPKCNRGKQDLAMCIVALAHAFLYAMSKFKQVVLDSTLAYGDRLYTVTRRKTEKELKGQKELKLTDEEIESILNTTRFKITDFPQSFCMGEQLAKSSVQMELISGDITSNMPEDIPNVPKGIEILFNEHIYGILQCRNYVVAVWKLDDAFYMFDPHPTGPSGIKSTLGVACITRFLNVEDLAQVFLSNLPHLGENFFEIHAFSFEKDVCKRERKPEVKEEKLPKLGGFTQIMAGKQILRSTLKLDCTKFDRGVHLHSSAIAFVALALSLAKEPETWTQIVINEILTVGGELYSDTLERLGTKFNPWEDRLDIYRLNTDFQVGRLRANCALRFTEQRGIVDIKNNPKIPNLRQGLERFFQENSHGVLIADKLTLAVWEESKGDEINIYIYDPNSRGATGLPAQGGVACAVKFCNAKVASDHIMACMLGVDKAKTNFAIVPVEVVIGEARSKRKVCKAMLKKQEVEIETKKASPKSKAAVLTVKGTQLVPPKKSPVLAKRLPPPPPPESSKPVTCPGKAAVMEQKRQMRKIAEEERKKEEIRRKTLLGRDEFYQVAPGISTLRSTHSIDPDKSLPVNLAAFVFFKVAVDLNKWNFRVIERIFDAGYLLHYDSYNAYRPKNEKLGLPYVLRRVILKEHEVKLEIKKPIDGGRFTREQVLASVNNLFNLTNFCMLNYADLMVSIYFKAGLYYLFDPYKRDINGNAAANGTAVLMRFEQLDDLVNKVVANLANPEEKLGNFVLIVATIQGVQPLNQ